MQIPMSRMCSTLYSTYVLQDPVSILHPFTMFKWFLYTLVRVFFPFIMKRLLEYVTIAVEKEHNQIL